MSPNTVPLERLMSTLASQTTDAQTSLDSAGRTSIRLLSDYGEVPTAHHLTEVSATISGVELRFARRGGWTLGPRTGSARVIVRIRFVATSLINFASAETDACR